MRVEPYQWYPPVALEEAEAAIREAVDRQEITAEHSENGEYSMVLGGVYWAEYGYLTRPDLRSNRDRQSMDRNWVLIFEDERDDPWYSSLWGRPAGSRFSAIYLV